jgi:uncharacterized protein (DUF427 family)
MNMQPNPEMAMATAIRNPANQDHLMFVQPVTGRITVDANGTRVADTTNALRVIELGKSVYEPRYYIPFDDVTVALETLDKTTHCPLKGDARYYALNGAELAWRYDTLDFACVLEGHLSFAADQLIITHSI